MSNNVDITFAGSSQEAQRVIDKLEQKINAATLKLDKMGQVSKRAGREGADSFDRSALSLDRMAKSALSTAAGLLSMRGLAQGFAAELEKINRINEGARLANLAPAQAIREAKVPFDPDSTVSEATFESKLKGIADRTTAPLEVVANAYEFASSAKGDFTQQDVMNAVETALKIDPSRANAQQTAISANRYLGIAQYSGTNDMKVSAGFVTNLNQASYGKDMEAIGSHLVPAINQMSAFGDTQEQAGEIGSALSQILQDSETRLTSTAMLQLAGKLKELHPERAKTGKLRGKLVGKDYEGEFAIPDEQFAEYQKAKNSYERIAVLQKSPELMREFVGQPGFDTKVREGVLNLVKGEEVAQGQLTQAQKTVRGTKTDQDRAFQTNLYDRKLDFYNTGESQAILETEQKGESRREQIELANTEAARRAAARKEFQLAMDKTNLPGPDDVASLTRNLQLDALNQINAKGEQPEDDALTVLRMQSRVNQTYGADNSFIETAIKTIEEQQQKFQDKAPLKSFNIPPQARGDVELEAALPPNLPSDREERSLLRQKQTAEIRLNRATNAGDEAAMREQTAILREISAKLDGTPFVLPSQAAGGRGRPTSQLSRGNQ